MKTLFQSASNRVSATHLWRPALLISLIVLLSGCQSVRNASERLGIDRRDVLVESLDHTSQSLFDLDQAFSEAKTELDEFSQQNEFPLRQRYEWLDERYVRCAEALDNANAEIDDLVIAARRFVLSWETELFHYSDPAIRDASRQQLNETRQEYETVISQVKEARNSAAGTLDAFRDYLSFMRHNLNNQAFERLQDPGADLSARMEELLKELTHAVEATNQLSDSLRVN